MPFRDQQIVCESCSRPFVFGVEEQRRQVALGFEPVPPTCCPECRSAEVAASGARAGVVKWFRDEKHFGFITQVDGSDVFFHRSAFEGDAATALQEKTPVWYEIVSTDRGPQAVNVKLR